jgi:hypothetical protein
MQSLFPFGLIVSERRYAKVWYDHRHKVTTIVHCFLDQKRYKPVQNWTLNRDDNI